MIDTTVSISYSPEYSSSLKLSGIYYDPNYWGKIDIDIDNQE